MLVYQNFLSIPKGSNMITATTKKCHIISTEDESSLLGSSYTTRKVREKVLEIEFSDECEDIKFIS